MNVCTDTAFLYVADNLVAPDTLRGENSHLLGISNQHYWSIVVPGDVLEGSMRFDIKAGSENDPDYEFLYGHTMNELVMLYRRNPGDVWMPLGTTKTGTLANGHLAVDGIRTGEYAIGIGDGTVGIDLAESEQTLFAVYPNPASDYLIVENVQPFNNQTLRCFIMDMNGRQVMSKMTLSNYNNLNISNLKSGIYLLSVESDGEVIYSTKFIKQ